MLNNLMTNNVINENINIGNLGGYVDVEVIRDSGDGPKIIKRTRSHNLVVNTGKTQVVRMLGGLQTDIWDQFRIGTSGAAANSGQTNLLSPIADSINTADSITLLAATRTVQYVISYPSGGGSISANGISEIALLNSNTSPGGDAFMRAVFTSVNKTTSDKVKFTYNIRVT